MFGGMNPRQMQKMMSQMGIKNEDVPCKKVTIEKEDGTLIVVQPASVVMIEMQGTQSFQVSGDISQQSSENTPKQETAAPAESQDDVAIVMQQTGATRQRAEDMLAKAGGDIAQAIMLIEGE